MFLIDRADSVYNKYELDKKNAWLVLKLPKLIHWGDFLKSSALQPKYYSNMCTIL